MMKRKEKQEYENEENEEETKISETPSTGDAAHDANISIEERKKRRDKKEKPLATGLPR